MGLLLEHLVPALGVLVANALFLSPLRAVVAASRQARLGGLNPLVFSAMWANCVSFLVYAFLKRDPYVLASNYFGALVSLWMLMACVGAADPSVAAERAARDAGVRAALFFGGFLSAAGAAIAFSNGVSSDRASAARAWGFVSVSVLLVFYASPLSALARVLRSRNSAALQLPLAGMASANGALWSAYGLAVGDAFLWAPNVVGTLFGLLQVALCLAYPPTPQVIAAADDLAGGGAAGGLLRPTSSSSGAGAEGGMGSRVPSHPDHAPAAF